jgi:LEA14-like dessication related protein
MKTRGWIILVVLALGSVWLISWFSDKGHNKMDSLKPTVSLQTLSISDIDSDKIKMTSRMLIHNPLPLALNTKRISYELFINNTSVLQTAYAKPLSIQSNDSSEVEIPMALRVKDLTQVLKAMEEKGIDSADYLLKTNFVLDVPIKGNTAFNVSVSKRLPALRLPKVRPEDIDIDKLTWKESKLEVLINVDNPNVFPIRMKDVAYTMTLGEDLALKGTKPGLIDIGAKSTTKIPLQLEVKNKEMLQLIGKTLGKSDTKFDVTLTADLLTRSEMIKGGNIAMRTEGTVQEIKEVLKKKN